MERARYLYLHAAIIWARTPNLVRAMVRHPFLTVAPLIIAGCLIAAVVTPAHHMESPTMHIIPVQAAP